MNTKIFFVLSLLIFVWLLFLVPFRLFSHDSVNTILTISTFLFGILAGFYIIVTHTDYTELKNTLAEEAGDWISLYRNTRIYDRLYAEKLSELIDKYIIHAFDYEVLDYVKETEKEFSEIEKLVTEMEYRESLSGLYSEGIIATFNNIVSARQKLFVLGGKALSVFQWFILFILAGVVIISLYGLRSGDLFFDIVTVSISSTTILILFLIIELDLYIWNEENFGFGLFQNLLKSMGRLPYYPAEAINKGRVHYLEKEYRVGILIDPAKNTDRRIEIKSSF